MMSYIGIIDITKKSSPVDITKKSSPVAEKPSTSECLS